MKKLQTFFSLYDISPGKLTVLIALARNKDGNGYLPSELSEIIGVTRGTITGLLDGLEKQKYVERKIRKDEDRRKVRIVLTGAGRKFLDSFLPVHYRKMEKITEVLNENERLALRTILGKIEKGLDDFESD